MKKEKLVIFDWGGVFELYKDNNMESPNFFMNIAKSLGVNVDKYKERLLEYLKSDRSKSIIAKTDKEVEVYVCEILDVFDLEHTIENISNLKKYFVIYSLDIPTNYEFVKYAHSLKSRCKIALLSNCTALEKFKQDLDVTRSIFDYTYISCEIGLKKPNKDIYNLVNELIIRENYEVLFIDDREKNLEYPKELGWNVHKFENQKKAIEYIENFLNN